MRGIGRGAYRSITADRGGPVVGISLSEVSLFDRPHFQANARLIEGLIPPVSHQCFGDAHGTGTHVSPIAARQLAISEALERWAYYAVSVSRERMRFGIDVDPTSNGFAASPGSTPALAREGALFEAVARFCLIGWWEGRIASRWMQTDWPGIDAITIPAPLGGFTVVLTQVVAHGRRAYGHAAASTFTGACERAMIELARCQCVLDGIDAHATLTPSDLVERRMLHFASQPGFAAVCDRVGRPTVGSPPLVSLACDEAVPGPWSRHATVWRCLFYPPTLDFLKPAPDYFFW